jgi:hypothetical protein
MLALLPVSCQPVLSSHRRLPALDAASSIASLHSLFIRSSQSHPTSDETISPVDITQHTSQPRLTVRSPALGRLGGLEGVLGREGVLGVLGLEVLLEVLLLESKALMWMTEWMAVQVTAQSDEEGAERVARG